MFLDLSDVMDITVINTCSVNRAIEIRREKDECFVECMEHNHKKLMEVNG